VFQQLNNIKVSMDLGLLFQVAGENMLQVHKVKQIKNVEEF
jgi:hypothetical protein